MTWQRWAAFVERYHRAIIAGSVVLGLLCAASIPRLRLDIDVLTMLPRGEPAFDDFKAFVADFGQLDELLVFIDGAPPPVLRRVADALAGRLPALDGIDHVHARIDTGAVADGLLGEHLFNYLPAEAYDDVAARLTPAAIDAQLAADRALLAAPFDLTLARQVAADPLGLRRLAASQFAAAYSGIGPAGQGGYFSSRDDDALLLFVRPTGSPFDIPFSERLLADVRQVIADTRTALGAGDVRVELAGSYVFAVEDAGTMKTDIVRYGALALLGVLTVFWLGYGNLRILPFVTYPLVLSTLLTFALSLLVFDQLNAVSISFDAILYGLSIDSGIHFYTRLLEQRRHGDDPRAAVAGTLAGLGRAHVASSATTAVAFLVIALSALGAVQQLGLLTAIGMGLTTLQFFTVYPALGFVVMRRAEGPLRDLDTPRLARAAASAQRFARAIRIALVIAAIVCGAAALRVRLDPSLTALRPADSPAMRLYEEIAGRFTRPGGSGAVLVRRPDLETALVDGERVAAVLRRHQADGTVDTVQSIDAILPSERTQRERLARFQALPRAVAVEHLRSALPTHGFKAERFAPFLDRFAGPPPAVVRLGDQALAPLGFALDHHIRQRADESIVAIYFDPAPGVAWPDLAARLRAELPDVAIAVAARPLLEEQLRQMLRSELALFLALSALGNFALLAIILRSVRLGFAVLAPVLVIVLALFAGMWLAGVAVDPINLVVTPLILGIGVDEGVYLVAAARERGGAVAAMRSVGRALTVTSLTTVVGFGFLAFSHYPPLATMGALVAIGLTLCLFTTVFVLPGVLPIGEEAETRKTAEDAEDAEVRRGKSELL